MTTARERSTSVTWDRASRAVRRSSSVAGLSDGAPLGTTVRRSASRGGTRSAWKSRTVALTAIPAKELSRRVRNDAHLSRV